MFRRLKYTFSTDTEDISMYFGVDWYPDQWGMEQVDEDLKDIKELGCDFVRIADFAWHYFEPEDGRYEFGFFDEVVNLRAERGCLVDQILVKLACLTL